MDNSIVELSVIPNPVIQLSDDESAAMMPPPPPPPTAAAAKKHGTRNKSQASLQASSKESTSSSRPMRSTRSKMQFPVPMLEVKNERKSAIQKSGNISAESVYEDANDDTAAKAAASAAAGADDGDGVITNHLSDSTFVRSSPPPPPAQFGNATFAMAPNPSNATFVSAPADMTIVLAGGSVSNETIVIEKRKPGASVSSLMTEDESDEDVPLVVKVKKNKELFK